MQRGLSITLMTVACSSSSPPAKVAPSCAPVIETALDRMMASAKDSMPPEAFANVAAMAPRMKTAIIDSCTTTRWSPEVLTCMSTAKSQSELNACVDKLTPAQKTSYETATAAAFMQRGRTP